MNLAPRESGLLNALKMNLRYPLHMPGHKRNGKFMLLPELWQDVTEIDGLDDLHNASGALAETQTLAAEIYGSLRAFVLVNGSTSGNLAAIRALHRQYGGSKVIVIGEPHRSVLHAAELCSLTVTDWKFRGDAHICVITSPSYDGSVLDLHAITAKCRDEGIAVHIDSAHGAHFGFDPYFPDNAVRLGADTVVESLHKTLPALGQCSLLHVCSDRVDVELIRHQLDIFMTSSPSYMLMASADHCICLLAEHGRKLFSEFADRLRRFYSDVAGIPAVRVPNGGCDPSRIVLYGENIPKLLRNNLLEPERIAGDSTILITTFCDDSIIFDRIAKIIKEN